MKNLNMFKTFVCGLFACGMGFVASSQADAQITYTITGFANNLGLPVEGPVAANESYTAVFEIDDTVVDSNPSPERGDYNGAIISSSITFSGGYTSTADFSGGNVRVQQNGSGHGLYLYSDDSLTSAIVLFSLDQLDDDVDALFTNPQEVAGLPGSLWAISETDGTYIISFSTGEQTNSLSITLPVLVGDVNQDGAVDFLDITSFITVLQSDSYMGEADINGDDVVDFLDVRSFIALLSS